MSLRFTVNQGSKQYVLPRVKVAKGVVATAAFASAEDATAALAPDKFQRIIKEKYAADIKFLVNQANIRNTELSKGDIKRLHENIANANAAANQEIEEINISSYASPEGGIDINTRLAQNREKNTSAYLNKELKKIISLSANLPHSSLQRTGRVSRSLFLQATFRTKSLFSVCSRCTRILNSVSVRYVIFRRYSTNSPRIFFRSSAIHALQLLSTL